LNSIDRCAAATSAAEAVSGSRQSELRAIETIPFCVGAYCWR